MNHAQPPMMTPRTILASTLWVLWLAVTAPSLHSQDPMSQAQAPPAWATRGRPSHAPLSVPAFDRLRGRIRRDGTTRLIVRLTAPTSLPAGFQPEPTLGARAAVGRQRAALAGVQHGVLARLGSAAAARAVAFDFVPFLAVEVDETDFLTLMNSPEVDFIEEDVAVPPVLSQSVPLIGAETDGTVSGYSGAGVAVAILDTGVDATHPFFGGRVVSEACFSTNSTGYAESVCPNGQTSQVGAGAGANCSTSISGCTHGTHVAGISAGQAGSLAGVAKDASIIAIQVFSKILTQASCGATVPCAMSFTSNQIAALQRVYELRGTYAIAAVNMSLGSGAYTAYCDAANVSLKAAIDTLRAANIATVIASGNGGSGMGISSPSCISSAVSVGSTTKADAVSSFSNSAPLLNLLAPGSSITSAQPNGAYAAFNGTSMAAPHVAGAWAVAKSKKPAATVDEVLMALKSTGVMVLDPRNGLRMPRISVGSALSQLSSQPTTILWRGTDGRLVTWDMSGTNRTSATVLDGGSRIDLFWTVVATADFNADNRADYVWRGADGRIVVWFMNGTTRTGVSFLNDGNAMPLEWRIAGAADYDGDGSPDLLWRHADGRVAVWFMHGVARTGAMFLDNGTATSTVWTIVGTPDLNGDGKADILWRHTDGRIVVWHMDRSTRIGVAFLNDGAPMDPAWAVVGTSDFNGDNQADLLWRHTDGRVALWFMRGITRMSTTFLNNGTTVGSQWMVSSTFGS